MESPESSDHSDLKTKLTIERRFSLLRRFEEMLNAFSPGERLILYGLVIILGASALALLAGLNAAVSVNVPSPGGSLREGLVGPARFVNPVLTMSDADRDLTALVYSGLTRALPDGTVIPDLASRYQISEDGTTYTFALRPDATFHDGTKLTSADVLFTVQLAQNPAIKSSHRADWEGVVASAPDSHTVVFKLPHAYAPFIENTSMGILPHQLWKDVTPEEFPFSRLNTRPVGSGPFVVANVDTDSTGSVTRYSLEPFGGNVLGKPYLRTITFIFYPNEGAMLKGFAAGEIDAVAGVTPDELKDIKRTDIRILTVPLPRVFGVFFNQGHAPALADASARAALDAAIDRERLVNMVLKGYGKPLDGPIPAGVLDASVTVEQSVATSTVSTAYTQDSVEAARAILSKGGWTFDASAGAWMKNKQQLTFTLATADAPELVATANAVATAWKQAGIKVTVQVYPLSEFNTTVLRPRSYDAVLFGEVVGRELDLFAFWHSSQRNDPGLNLALYANAKVDTLLSQARATTNEKDREKLYAQFTDLLVKDQPAIFLYSPDFVYVVPKSLKGISLGALTTPADRFLGAYRWYTDTERVWNVFSNTDDSQTI